MGKNNPKEIPLGIKIISIIHYITCALYFLFGLSSILFSKGIAVDIVVENKLDPSLVVLLSTWILIISVVFMMGMAVLEFFIAKGLWKARRWTRKIVIIFGIINLIFLTLIFFVSTQKISGIISICVFILGNLTIISYLILNKPAKEYFWKK